MIDWTAAMSATAFCTFATAISRSSARITVDRLLVGGFGLVGGALALVQGIGRLVEPRLRRVAMLGQLADAVIGFLGKDHAGLRPLQCRLARRNHLRARAGLDIGELRIGHHLGSERLLVLRERLRIVDPHQHGAGGDVLPALHRDVGDTPVDPRGDVEARGVHLALYQQGLRPHEVPDRQTGDDGDDQPDDDGGNPSGSRRAGGRCFLRVQGHSFRWSVGCLHLQSKPRQTCIVSFTRSGQNQGGGVLLVKSSRYAARAYLVRGLAHTGPESCQPPCRTRQPSAR